MKSLTPIRTVTFRRWGIPAVILEGKWITKRYGWKIGDKLKAEYLPKEIRLSLSSRAVKKQIKNSPGGEID
jgi:hypothetical protein